MERHKKEKEAATPALRLPCVVHVLAKIHVPGARLITADVLLGTPPWAQRSVVSESE